MADLDSGADTLACVYYQEGFYRGVDPLLREFVDKSPGYAVCHYHLGMAPLADGDKAKGKEQVEAALKLGLSGDDSQQAHKTLAQPH